MTKSILVALGGALTLGLVPGCANDLRDDPRQTAGLNLESEGEREFDDESEESTDADQEAGAAERTPDDGAPEEAPPDAATPAERTPEEQAIADCWSVCVSIAFPNLLTCSDASGDSEGCTTAFYAEVYACAASECGAESAPEEPGATDASDAAGGEAAGSISTTTDDTCYISCRGQANAVIEACRGYGYGDDLCLASGQAQLDSCVTLCDEAADAEAPTGAGDAGGFDFYEAAFCDSGVFLQSDGIGRDEALENCLLNEASNPDRGVVCTWNGEIIRDSCGPNEGIPAPATCEGWEPTVLDRAQEFIDETYWNADVMNCDGPSFRRFDARYGLWVGLVSCGTGYRFFLAETADGTYLPAADYGGHGQDLCELLNPEFSLPLEDDITSGGCTECTIGFNYSFVAGEVYARGAFGQPFTRGEAPEWGPYQSSVISCAAGPLECDASGDLR